MKALILASGKGTRLMPLTRRRNKGMLPVAGKPVLERIIEHLAQNGLKEIVMAVGVKKKQVMNYFQDGARLGVQIQYSESKEAQGTAGEIARARDLELISGTFLLYYGDTLTGISLKAMTAVHRHYNALITTPTIRGIPLETSLIETDFDGRITRFSEKPLLMEKANIPVFVVDKSVLRHANIAKGKDFSSDVVSQLVALGRVFEYDEERHYPFVDYSRAKLAANGNYHYDVGTLKRYEDICRAFEKGYAGAVRVIK